VILTYQAIGCCHDIAARKYHAPLCQATAAFAAVVIRALARRVPLRLEEKGVRRLLQAPPRIAGSGHGGNFFTGWSKERSRGRGGRRKEIAAGVLQQMGLTGAMG